MTTALRAAAGRPAVVESRAALAQALAPVRRSGGRVLLVPTMGALHDGHARLVREAAAAAGPGDVVVVSIFVNPMQFSPGEDLSRYPRTPEEDLEVCAGAGAHLVFAPPVDEVYPDGQPQVTVDPGPLAEVLEGEVRPTHFRGVLTVVARLFGLVRPDQAFFGEKDYQQLVLVRRMVADLCLGVEVTGVETVRGADGLALSSRNRYLDDGEHLAALALSQALSAGTAAAGEGADHALAAARAVLRGAHGVDLDYLALTSPDLDEPPAQGEARLLIAARVGTTRLIDNTALVLGPTAGHGTGSG